ncbi:superoxide dismutase [Cu-Zn], partial [Clonorchis sinensis]
NACTKNSGSSKATGSIPGIATFVAPYDGQVHFVPLPNGRMQINGSVSGLPPNETLGVHVHETGDISNHCLNAGAHWSFVKRTHGGLDSKIRHDGDLGNLQTDRKGRMTFNLRVTPSQFDPTDGFIGLSLVIHEQQDDLGLGGNATSLANGNSGRRVACAVIGYKKKPTFG